MTLEECLTDEVLGWEKVGHHALLQRFVLRQGKAYKNDARTPPHLMREIKMCFRNATKYCRDYGGTYVEGFVMKPNLPILIHHAWVATDDDFVIDPTLRDSEHAKYFGVPFKIELVLRTTLRQGHYGMAASSSTLALSFRGSVLNANTWCNSPSSCSNEQEQKR